MKKLICILILVFILGFVLNGVGYSQELKRAEFSGSWYPAHPDKLKSMLDTLLRNAAPDLEKEKILGIIVPHAGYIYSASVAAQGFKILENKQVRHVILLGASHKYYFEGVSIYPQGSFETPLGNLTVDSKLASQFRDLSFVQFEPKYFMREHSLEVELPFIKKIIPAAQIVPILFGKVTHDQMQQLAQKLLEIASGTDILIVVSSDLSHFHPYYKAGKIDQDTIQLIETCNTRRLWETREYEGGRACGICPIVTFLEYSKKRSAKIKILKYANSGDTAGGRGRVVGYVSAVAYLEPTHYKSNKVHSKEEKMQEYTLSEEEKLTLLQIARKILEAHLKGEKLPQFKIDSSNLSQKRGAFVTLKKKGQLRGCIGRIVADTPLYDVISNVAIDSAVHDPRFPPVRYEELKDIEIEISVLTPFTEVKNIEEIEVGTHGLMIRKGFHSGLLLPQVPTEYGWDRQTFLQHTCLKAGLPPSAYSDKGATLYRFSAIVFGESDSNENSE
ncbi:MAG: AmmeMemoRadiSam system protein B [Candidatus Omnitrophota bacterium]|nr:MAG: AmmeMemoRadiSam system protein B [Candidatus Omnitrophota bacterium]